MRRRNRSQLDATPFSYWRCVIRHRSYEMTGQLDSLDEKQKEILSQFKDRIKDCQLIDSGDDYILKWLIAREFDLDEAEKMLRDTIEWRRVHRVNEILDTWQPPEVLRNYYSMSKTGLDKFGCPVWVSAQGRLDLKGILHCVTKRDYMRFMIWIMESMDREIREENKRSNKHITKQTFVFDMEGLSMRQLAYKPSMDCGKEIVRMFEVNYPECLRRVFIVNAPTLFTLLFSIIKPFMHQATIDKIRVFGANKSEWAPAVLEDVEPDQLPEYYGGTLTSPDGDPKCPHLLNMAGEVPHEYYISNDPPQVKDYMETATIIAGAGGWKKLKFKVDEVNSILRWEFITEGGDIGFRVYYKHPKDGIVDVVPFERVESHMLAEEGQIVCEQSGKYVVEFDNTFSYFKAKKLRYYVTVESPVDEKSA